MTTPAEMDGYTPPRLPTPTAGKVVFVAPGGSDAAAGTKDLGIPEEIGLGGS